MDSYFALFIKPDKGVPICLEATLQTDFYDKDPLRDRELYPDVSWRTTLHKQVKLPDKLWLVTKDRLYNFDVYPYLGGFLVSDYFIRLMDEFKINNYEKRELNVVNVRKEIVKSNNLFYIKFHNGLDVIDLEKSEFDRDKKGGYIKKFHKIYLLNESVPDLFLFNGLVLSNRLICSNLFKLRAEELAIVGAAFVSVESAGNYKEYS